MTIFTEGDYTVHVCQDIYEWGKEFYGVRDGEEIANEEELLTSCMGYAQIEDKFIWIFIPPNKPVGEDLPRTIAHEVGHCIESSYRRDLTEDSEDALHEEKANHYEEFFVLSNNIYTKILRILYPLYKIIT